MPRQPGPPLRKVTLNLYDDDVRRLATYYGHGWSEHVRDLLHSHVTTLFPKPRTVEDYITEDLDGE